MYNSYGGDNEEITVNFQLLQGKTDEELEKICVELLGEIKQGRENDFSSSFFSNALSKEVIIDDLASRIAEDRNHRETGWKEPDIDDSTKHALENEFGYGAVNRGPTPLVNLVYSALNSEARKITSTSLIRNNDVSREEIDRRIKLLTNFCDEKALQSFLNNCLAHPFYTMSEDKLEESFVRNGVNYKVSDLQSNLPVFLNVIDSLLDAGVDLDRIELRNGYSALQVYNTIKERFGDYIQGNEIIEPQKESLTPEVNDNIDIVDSVVQDEIKNSNDIREMFNDVSAQSLSVEEIQRQMEENNKTILELMAKNQELLSQLSKLQNTDQVQITK